MIQIDRLVNAIDYTGWATGFFRPPKLHIICGHCKAEFSTRRLHPFYKRKRPHGIVACCSYCGYWNWMNLEFS